MFNLSSDTIEKSFWWIFILFRTLMIYMELIQVTKATEILDIILQSFNKLSISRDSSFNNFKTEMEGHLASFNKLVKTTAEVCLVLVHFCRKKRDSLLSP